MRHLRSRSILPVLVFLFAFLVPFTLSPADLSEIEALAPVELVAEGFKEPMGVVVDQNGVVFVSDRKSGEVLQISAGAVHPVITHLQRPVGLAFDQEGRLLIVEEKTGLLLRMEPSGALTILAQGIKKPRWVAAAEDGNIYISAKGLKSSGDKEGDDEDEEQGEVILRLTPSGQLSLFANGFKTLQGLEIQGHILFAAAKGIKSAQQKGDDRGGVFQVPILPDGSAGAITRLTQIEIEKPVGLALDVLGALYVSAEELELPGKDAKDAIGKVAVDGTVARFASKLEKPRGLAFDSFGNLYVADDKGDHKGRIIRFGAPPSPTLVFPSFTNQNPLTVQGTTEPQSRIDGLLNDSALPATFTDGVFSLILNLLPNAQNFLAVFTTAHNGLGLTSAPAEFTIVHDDIPPTVSGLQPLNSSYLNTNRPLIRANLSDNLSGVDTNRVAIALDGVNVTAQASLTASGFTLDPLNPSTLKLFPLPEGSRTVFVTIFDRAGNSTSASSTFTVDVTPPDTQITSGPQGTISATSTLFTFTGTDNLTPTGNLQFSWRLDGGPFSSFSSETQASFTGLSPGPHTFEVKARDLAGNEDPTPASRTFTVSVLTVKITDPADGAAVNAGALLVRGAVEAGGVEVGVTVNGFSAAVQGSTFAALVPVTPDTTTLTAAATTAAGATANHSVNITVLAAPAPAFTLLASPKSGVAPLTASFSLLGSTTISSVELDFDGNGTADFTGAGLEGQTFTYTQAGLYFPRATITDTLGNQFTANAIVQVFDRIALDVMLQAKWTGMKDALRRGDTEGAIQFIATDSRAEFRADFSALTQFLPTLASTLDNIRLVAIRGEHVEYELLNVENGSTFSYYVEFIQDTDGVWRIVFF